MSSVSFKKFLGVKKIGRVVKNRTSSRCSSHGKIGLILDNSSITSTRGLMTIHRELGYTDNDLYIAVYSNGTHAIDDIEASFFDKEDISWLGSFKPDAVSEFRKHTYDVLICNFEEGSWPAALLGAVTSAIIKVGPAPDAYDMLDLVIETDRSDLFRQEVIKYLKILKK